jgi:PGM1 C-terminal domain/ATP-grasp domain
LFTIPVLDGSPRPLSVKLLERPRLMERIRALIPDPERAHLVPYNTTELERDLAVRLGIPMYGADPRYFVFGTKSGCRRLFEEEGVPHPLGVENLKSVNEVADAIVDTRRRKPEVREVLVKLNEGVSGEGNALVDLSALPEPGSSDERAAVEKTLAAMQFELPEGTYDDYVAKLAERGCVIEERIQGRDFKSPSVQLRVTPLGDVELLSTHDQLLGGKSGQSYLGCVFPANPEYAAAITREAAKIGARLAREGVIGRLALDFVTVRNDAGDWEIYAIEINLRKGGTTHPFLTLQFLTDGTYDAQTATFTAPSGKQKYFVASDHVDSPDYRGLTPDDLFDIVVRHGLHFDQSRQTGVVFHMMAALAEAGRVGLTAVADSPTDARELYERAIAVIDAEAADASAERPLPA